MAETSNKILESVLTILENEYGKFGYEFHPFKVAWYNECVNKIFHVDLDGDTAAILIVSNPSMFEATFLPFLKTHILDSVCYDPIDECNIFYLSSIKQLFPDLDVEVVHDFDLHPNRRPKMLMQTAGHVSGAAYFYQQSSVAESAFGNKKIYGVCIHPKYGGWFALRAVVFIKNLRCPDLVQRAPEDVIPLEKDRICLLDLYNYHWQDWTFRDLCPVSEKYSPLAIKYFSTAPKDRLLMLTEFIEHGT